MKVEWQVKKLREVCNVEKRQSRHFQLPYVGLEDIESNSGRFVGKLNPQSVKSSTFWFCKEHLLYGKLRPYLNKVMLPDFEGHCSTEIFPIRPSKLVSKEFLCYWLRMDSTVENINRTCTGARMPRANMNAVLDFEVRIPPIYEQQRIVAILDESFDGIITAKANTERNLKNIRDLFENYLQSVFSDQAAGWAEKRLGDVCELFQGLAINAKTKHLLVSKSSLPLLRIKDLRNNDAEQFVAESGYPKNALVNESDIIYTRTGQIGLVFRGRRGVLHNNCFKIRPNPILRNDYLFWWLQNSAFYKRVITLASKAAQPDITHTIFKMQPILIPPLEYQDQVISIIVELSENIKSLESIYQQKIVALDELKQSLLHQAFNGDL